MAIKRYAHNLSHNVTGTVNMGLNYPVDIMEVFPGDSFRITAKNLSRFMPQIAPTTSDVFAGFDFYDVPLRQLCELVGINWDKYLTGGQNGTDMIQAPTITIPESGYEPGSLADWLGFPTNYMDPSTNQKVVVGAGLVFDAWPVIAYMHIIDSNYLDQNFIQHLDFTKYQEFLDGTYQFKDAQGNLIDYDILVDGIFPKAWSRDYFGRAMSNTQRGPVVNVPVGETADLQPNVAPIVTGGYYTPSVTTTLTLKGKTTAIPGVSVTGSDFSYSFVAGNIVGSTVVLNKDVSYGVNDSVRIVFTGDNTYKFQELLTNGQWQDVPDISALWDVSLSPVGNINGTLGTGNIADLSKVSANLLNATGISLIAFRTAARMQRFGEILQQAGARAVEYTMAFFGVRVPDGRAQRPIFHGSFNMPVVFSEVLQTSQTTDTAPLAYMAGHGITGGVNRPIHIKCIEHGYIVVIGHFMPRSQYQQYIPKYLLRFNRMDIPNPLFQHIGEQAVLRKEIYPNSANPDDTFGYVPRYTELTTIPSVLRGHMKDTFLHWSMARVYNSEPVLSAAWRYEKPSNRSFSVPDEDQIVMSVGFDIQARRVFKRNPNPGIHIV
ncbi:major capsid protein [Chicken microvirus mg7_25]|nr:major capsid protein [Chicken microvirus mg7_25]